MTASHFHQSTPNTAPHQTELTALANFIQSTNQATLLYNNGEKGGEIDFDNAANTLGHFTSTNFDHIDLLESTTKMYQTHLKQLQTIDFKLALSFTLGVAALAFAPLTFGLSGIISAIAFSYFGYQLCKREQVQKEYKQAQADMTNMYIWTMNDTKAVITKDGKPLPQQNDDNDATYAKAIQDCLHPQIKNMHEVFNPMLSDQDIWAYTRNDLDNAITVDRNYCNDESISIETTTKLQLSMNYLLYGQDQGSPMQITKGLGVMFGQTLLNMCISIKDGVLSMIGMNEKEVVDKVIDTAATSISPNF